MTIKVKRNYVKDSTGSQEMNWLEDGNVVHTEAMGKVFFLINVLDENNMSVKAKGSSEEVLALVVEMETQILPKIREDLFLYINGEGGSIH